nr:hypothetical protein GCM10025699_56240 [Microbacterium flavescens]
MDGARQNRRHDVTPPDHQPAPSREVPFGGLPHPRLPVFRAPDGEWYVDRDGLGPGSERRWRAAFDAATVRRRRLLAGLGVVLRSVLLAVACASAGALVGVVVGGSGVLPGVGTRGADFASAGDPTGVIVGGALGLLVGIGVAIGVMLATQPDGAPGPVVRVPEEVLVADVDGPPPRRVWLWSTALDAEATARRTIGYEVEVERPAQAASAARARARYAAIYGASVEAARDLGIPPRAPAIPLEP